ncbi:type II toxin-antitoxin system RelE/ParE family toxin [Rhodopseudomonas palustris]|uniref:Type II toxin-antitoxin system RelE/ParE family toxin n=1 Tax=Rhodopseudomonas palustris (strain BisB18) TaxID=316056 RepID=Q214V0_RHOPB
MKPTHRTDEFAAWLRRLSDPDAIAKVTARIDRLRLGNPGDAEPVGAGVSELRIHYGPGYRVYYAEHRSEIIILLAGGTKKTQNTDIKQAKRLFKEWTKR